MRDSGEQEVTNVAKFESEEQVVEFVRDQKKNKRKSWDTIAAELKKAGYTSPRTGRPLQPNTVRYYYFYGTKKDVKGNHKGDGQTTRMTMIEKVLDMDIKPENKVELIRAIVSEL